MGYGPGRPLPVSPEFASPDAYVDALLDFVTTSTLFQTFAGETHILDFFSRDPDLYETILPEEWRDWFDDFDEPWEIVDWLLRSDLSTSSGTGPSPQHTKSCNPPESLIEYVQKVRRLSLVRDVAGELATLPDEPERKNRPKSSPSRQARVAGMSLKKQHEVVNFASYVSKLTDRLSDSGSGITHIIDFGSGANYLGRSLAGEPYRKNIVAIESREHVVEGARRLDVIAKLAPRNLVSRDKKENNKLGGWKKLKSTDPESPRFNNAELIKDDLNSSTDLTLEPTKPALEGSPRIQYVHHRIENGDLSDVIGRIQHSENSQALQGTPSCMVISLHSCGTLVNHGLRTMTLNPSVQAVAMVGCCYNLISERLPTGVNSADEHGFPMSSLFLNHSPSYPVAQRSNCRDDMPACGIRLNISARMMGVQAPRNWTRSESDAFFIRHYYRALLQKLFRDHHIVPSPDSDLPCGRSPAGTSSSSPVIIGKLSKNCYTDFLTYVRAAIRKICDNSTRYYGKSSQAAEADVGEPPRWVIALELAQTINTAFSNLSDSDIINLERNHHHRLKYLSVIWTLMAFSAELIEALVVIDRWLWLKEQVCVKEAWVESVWEYRESPRNLVIVGVKG